MSDHRAPIPTPDPAFVRRRVLPITRAMARYHRFEIHGAELLPTSGPALVLSTHALLVYETLMLVAETFERTGRLPRGLGDDFWWRAEPVARALAAFGIVRAAPDAAQRLLEAGEIVGLAVGGMWEALRPSTERHTLRWGQRRGFARLALQTGAPVYLAACPDADHIMTVYPSRLTDAVYKRWHLPLPFARGLGPTPIPRPVKLRYWITGPLVPPPILGSEPDDDEIEAFRAHVVAQMEAWLASCAVRSGR